MKVRKFFPALLGKTRRSSITPGPELPLEIVTDILTLVHEDSGAQALLHKALFQHPPRETVFELTITANQARGLLKLARSFFNYALVSRVWYISATPFLYSRVILVSHKQVERLSRTMTSSPTAGAFIKELYFVQGTNPALSAHGQGLRDLPRKLKLVLSRKGSSQEFTEFYAQASAVLKSCQNLKVLHMGLPNHFLNARVCHIFASVVDRRRLREFTIHGHSVDIAFAKCLSNFTRLEVLCFNRVVTSSSFVFPNLPRLHTLKIIQSSFWFLLPQAYRNGPILTSLGASSLRSLHLHGSFIRESTLHSQVDRFPFLNYLSALSYFDVMAFGVIAQSAALLNVGHLAIGELRMFNHPLATRNVAQTLTTLTLLWDWTDPFLPLTPFRDFLELNEPAIRERSCLLRRVMLYVYWDKSPHLPSLASWKEEISHHRVLCRTLRLEFGFDIIGQWKHSSQILLRADSSLDPQYWLLHAQRKRMENIPRDLRVMASELANRNIAW